MEDAMSGKINLKDVSIYIGVIILGIAAGVLAASYEGIPWIAHAQVAGAPQPVRSVDTSFAAHECNPQIVGTFPDRVNVYCGNEAPGGIVDFSAPTSDSRNANRILSIMLTAKALGRNLFIYYNPNGDGSAFGCPVVGCRPIDGIELYFVP
jgi:hypothetical protein